MLKECWDSLLGWWWIVTRSWTDRCIDQMTNERRAAAAFPYGCAELNPPAKTGRVRRDTWQLPSCELCVVSGRERPETERHLSPLTSCDRNSSFQIINHFMDLSGPHICFKCAVALIHIQYWLSLLKCPYYGLWKVHILVLGVPNNRLTCMQAQKTL